MHEETCLGSPIKLPGGQLLVLLSDDSSTWLTVRDAACVVDRFPVISRRAAVVDVFMRPHDLSKDEIETVLDALLFSSIPDDALASAVTTWQAGQIRAACRMVRSMAGTSSFVGVDAKRTYPGCDGDYVVCSLATTIPWLPTPDSSPIVAAISYLNHGYQIVALHTIVGWTEVNQAICSCAKGMECKAPGKHPRMKGWKSGKGQDEEAWRRWPDSNVGLAMGGKQRIVAIDVDGARGREELTKLEKENEALPRTLTQRTGREGGEQRIYYVPEEYDLDRIRSTVGVLGAGLDVRATGALIVVSPSIHKSKRRYEWIERSAVSDIPKWLYDKLATAPPGLSPDAPMWRPGQAAGVPMNRYRPLEQSLPALEERIAWAARRLTQTPPAIEGQNGSAATLKAAIMLVRGYCLPPEDALKLMMNDYNTRCIPPWSESELIHKIDSAEMVVKTPWAYLLGEPNSGPKQAAGG